MRDRTRKILLGELGFADVYCAQAAVCRWDEVRRINERLATETLPILKIPGAGLRVTAHSIQLERWDGKAVSLDKGSIARFEQFVEQLRAITSSRSIPWIVDDRR